MVGLRIYSFWHSLFCLPFLAAPLSAAITPAGDVYPAVFQPINPTVGVGDTSDGSLLVDAGSVLSSNGGGLGGHAGVTGTVTITDVGSEWSINNNFYVGSHGNGVLVIESGAKVTSNSFGYVGYWEGSMGSVAVRGDGSQWNNSREIYVGYGGAGTLVIEAGGKVTSFGGFVGAFSSSPNAVTVTGDGSKWTSSSILRIGEQGTGTLTVSDGGEVITTILYASGGDLYGDGTITVTEGGIVDAELVFDAAHGNQAIATFGSGGTLSFRAAGRVLGVGNKNTGSITISDGVIISSLDGLLGRQNGSSGTATISGIGSQWAINRFSGTSSLGGTLSVGGTGNGLLTISGGGLVNVGRRLTIDSDSSGNSFINMATGGMLALAGDADDSLTQFLSLVSGTDAIRYWNASLASWSPLTTATFGTDYTLEYLTTGDLAGYTLLSVGRVGDFDNDGDVDGRDLLAWQRNPELGSLADWQNAYGSTSLSAATAVPESNSLVFLLGLTLLSWCVGAVPS